MSIFVVKGERTFYNDEVHRRIPSGAIKISHEFYEKLLQAQSEYKILDFSVCPLRSWKETLNGRAWQIYRRSSMTR